MKILWVKPGKLLPLDSGGRLRTYNILRRLCTTQEVTFLSYYGGTRDEEYERQILQQLPGTVCVHAKIPDGTGAAYFEYIRHLPFPLPIRLVSSQQHVSGKCLRIGFRNGVSMLRSAIFWPAL